MCLLHAAIAREQQLLRRCAGCAYGPSAGDAACMRVLLRGGGEMRNADIIDVVCRQVHHL